MFEHPCVCERHRFSTALIAHAMWFDFRFLLSLRLVEERLLARARHCRFLRDHPPLGGQVRPGHRPRGSSPSTPSRATEASEWFDPAGWRLVPEGAAARDRSSAEPLRCGTPRG
jgi:hypothetical protein